MAVEVINITCPGCGAPVDTSAKNCKVCGRPVVITTFNNIYLLTIIKIHIKKHLKKIPIIQKLIYQWECVY